MSHSNQATMRNLKQQIFTCLTKLSDRDTHSIAVAELESIARTLTHDSIPTFLSCIHSTNASDKSPVRKQCVKMLSLISESHGNSLSPHLAKMLSFIVLRLRDSDTAIRAMCVDAVRIMSARIARVDFASFEKPLTSALFTEQDFNAQIGSAMCLAAAIEVAPDPEAARLKKLVPKLERLLRCDGFKAKAAVLALIGSVVEAGGACSHALVKCLVPCLVEFLSSEDWMARRGAADALAKLAVAESDLMPEFKVACLKVVENRRFDKVKIVRDSMNQMLETWKEVPDLLEEVSVSPPLQSHSSSQDNVSDGRYPIGSKGSCNVSSVTPTTTKKKITSSRSPPSDGSSATTAKKRSPLKTSDRNTNPTTLRNMNDKKPPNWKIEVAASHKNGISCRDENVVENGENSTTKTATKRVLFSKSSDDNIYKFGGNKYGSRVVPCDEENCDSITVVSNAAEDLSKNHRESEELSLIRKQLLQIENQQSSLLDLLQKFIGTSQNGMQSLETRVHGLEVSLDEISYDLAVSNGRMTNTDPTGASCCMLPGAEFLSSKFWKKPEGQYRYSTSAFSSARDTPSVSAVRFLADKNMNAELSNLEKRRIRLQGGSGFVVNPLAEVRSNFRGISESSGGQNAASPVVTGTSLANVMSRSFA